MFVCMYYCSSFYMSYDINLYVCCVCKVAELVITRRVRVSIYG
jgi:hypothetical protein